MHRKGRLLESFVFYEVLGGVQVWRAGRVVLGCGPGGPPGPPGGPPRGGPGGSLGLRCGPQGAPQKGTVLSRVIVLGVFWCPLGCLGGSRAVRVTVGLRMLSGLLLWLLRLPGFRGRSPRRHPKTAKGKSGHGCLFCSCLSLGLSLGLPGRVSVHLALCRSVALCRFVPLCPACSQNFPY